MWEALTALSEATKKSVGDLVRSAVSAVYFSDEKKLEISKAFDNIVKTREVSKGKINYKALIENGRKY